MVAPSLLRLVLVPRLLRNDGRLDSSLQLAGSRLVLLLASGVLILAGRMRTVSSCSTFPTGWCDVCSSRSSRISEVSSTFLVLAGAAGLFWLLVTPNSLVAT